MRKVLLLLSAIQAFSVYAACPETAPGSMALETLESCNAYTGCPNGPVTLVIEPRSNNPMPPEPYDPGYAVEPCDVVEWNFGDGTTQIVQGLDRVTHDYPTPGNYTIQATGTNALGSKSLTTTAVIATSPSRLSFATSTFKVPYPTHQSTCTNCVQAREGELTRITVTRTLDLSRTVSAELTMTVGKTKISLPVTFAPGQTEKTVSITVPDDGVYSGFLYSPLGFAQPQGGTLTLMNVAWQPTLVIIDDDPVPTFSIVPELKIAEGFAGLVQVAIPVSLTAPMGGYAYANTFFSTGSATNDDYLAGTSARIQAGETSGAATAWIRGDAKPEPDEVFEVTIAPPHTTSDPLFGTTTALVTIVNDDAAVYPVRTTAPTGAAVKLTLDIGSPYATATTAHFTTSDANVVLAPGSVVIPAGATKVEVLVRTRGRGSAQLSATVPDRMTAPAEIVAVGKRRRAAAH